MSYLSKEESVSLINIKLTDRGREFLAKGFKDDNVFDLVKFSLGDSEVDYTNEASISSQQIMEPTNNASDLKSKLYASGVIPDGIPLVSLSISNISMTTYQSGVEVVATTQWSPVEGTYIEEYSWTNLGPLEDYDFGITRSMDTRTATIRAYDVTGTTVIKITGMLSGAYALLTLSIS